MIKNLEFMDEMTPRSMFGSSVTRQQRGERLKPLEAPRSCLGAVWCSHVNSLEAWC